MPFVILMVKNFTLLFLVKLSSMEIAVRKAQKKLDWLQIIIIFALLFIVLVITGCTSREPAPFINQSAVEPALVEVLVKAGQDEDIRHLEGVSGLSQGAGGE